MKFACVLVIVVVSFSASATAQKKAKDSKTTYAKEALQPYVDNGQLAICYAMANFISHTATASLLVPILAAVGASAAVSANLAPLGGVSTLLIGVAIGSSLGMVLPISTPPNAIAAATGMIEQKEMVKTGLIMGVLGLILGYSMLIVLGSTGLI